MIITNTITSPIVKSYRHTFASHLYPITHNDVTCHYHERRKGEPLEDPYYKDLLRILG